MEDAEILEKFADKHTREEAFTLLLDKYQQKIYWHVRRYVLDHDDADDIVQDIFIKVLTNLENFRVDATLYTCLYRIASNECITFLKTKKQYMSISLNHEPSSYFRNTLTDSTYFIVNNASL